MQIWFPVLNITNFEVTPLKPFETREMLCIPFDGGNELHNLSFLRSLDDMRGMGCVFAVYMTLSSLLEKDDGITSHLIFYMDFL